MKEVIGMVQIKSLLLVMDDKTINSAVKNKTVPVPFIRDNEEYWYKEEVLKSLGVKDNMHEPFISKKEAAYLVGCDINNVSTLATKGVIPSYRISAQRGTKLLYRESELVALGLTGVEELYGFYYLKNTYTAITKFLDAFFANDIVLDEFFSPRQKEVLRLLLVERKRPVEISRQLHLSDERIRQLVDESLSKFRSKLPHYISQLKEMVSQVGQSLDKARSMPATDSVKKKSRAFKGKNLLRAPIEEFGFSARARNIIRGEKIELMGELVRYSSEDVLLFRGMGGGTLKEIKGILSKEGLKLND